MRLVLHPKVHSDVDAIMGYYERVGSRKLADDFYTELRRFMLEAAERPLLNFRLIPAGVRTAGAAGWGCETTGTGWAFDARAGFDLLEHFAKLGGDRLPLFVGLDGAVEDGFAFRVFRGERALPVVGSHLDFAALIFEHDLRARGVPSRARLLLMAPNLGTAAAANALSRLRLALIRSVLAIPRTFISPLEKFAQMGIELWSTARHSPENSSLEGRGIGHQSLPDFHRDLLLLAFAKHEHGHFRVFSKVPDERGQMLGIAHELVVELFDHVERLNSRMGSGPVGHEAFDDESEAGSKSELRAQRGLESARDDAEIRLRFPGSGVGRILKAVARTWSVGTRRRSIVKVAILRPAIVVERPWRRTIPAVRRERILRESDAGAEC